jgi:hypothetical protein
VCGRVCVFLPRISYLLKGSLGETTKYVLRTSGPDSADRWHAKPLVEQATWPVRLAVQWAVLGQCDCHSGHNLSQLNSRRILIS